MQSFLGYSIRVNSPAATQEALNFYSRQTEQTNDNGETCAVSFKSRYHQAREVW